MLHLRDVTYRIGGRTLFEGASAHLPKGHKGALVGLNGSGKTSLFRLITGEIMPDAGELSMPKDATLGIVAQEVREGLEHTVIDFVLMSHKERAALLSEAESATDPDRIAHVHERLLEIHAYEAPSRAAKILAGLGFSEEAQAKPLSAFSGGWRMRVALACALFLEPDLLLLDEPTNHLDLEAAMWLEGFLKTYPRTLLLISHDRTFINAVADRIYHLHDKTLTFYNGNFDFFERTRRERLALLEAEKRKQDTQRAHMQQFIDRFRYKSSKARQVQSRLKQMAKFEPLSTMPDDPLMNLNFPDPEELAPPLVTLDKVSVGYGETTILKRLGQCLDADDRIALLGANGNGKTTFAKLLAGLLPTQTGEIYRCPKLRVGYYHQHQLEALTLGHTAYDHMAALMRDALEPKVRARLGRFGFPGDKADIVVEKLSGGEKARLNLALISYQEPQILILDEPTNHLDLETREALIFALNAYKGAVILITHDWHLLEMTADQLWLVENQTVTTFDGTLEDYKKYVLKGLSSSKADSTAAFAPHEKSRAQEIREKKQAKKKQILPKGGKGSSPKKKR